ncbi:MAG: hypothetical protein D6720_13475 [Gammaproteobacteria bacterium]|nr:MAG: hypothetical protein D6720_13475 [Gammaproteobacteria bacterium]
MRERNRPPGFENPKRVRCRLWVELELSRRRPSDARQIGELIAGWDSRGHDRIGLVYPVQAQRPEDYARAAKALRATIKAARKAWVESRSHTPDLMTDYVYPLVDVFLIHFSAQLRFESVVKLGSLGMVTAYRYDLRRLEHSNESEPLHHLVEAARAQSSF